MTDEMMDLRKSVEKSADGDLLREMIGFTAQRLMELEVGAATGPRHGEKSPIVPFAPRDYIKPCRHGIGLCWSAPHDI